MDKNEEKMAREKKMLDLVRSGYGLAWLSPLEWMTKIIPQPKGLPRITTIIFPRDFWFGLTFNILNLQSNKMITYIWFKMTKFEHKIVGIFRQILFVLENYKEMKLLVHY